MSTVRHATRPDVRVAIDLGATSTGVAWATQRLPIQVISDWPGHGDEGQRRVPIKLVYNADGSLSSWGFLCAVDDQSPASGKTRHEDFTIFIDKATLNKRRQQGTTTAPLDSEQARTLTTEYLRQIHCHINKTIERHIQDSGGWTNVVVTFYFSVPPTSLDTTHAHIFKRVLRDAGFGTGGTMHSVVVMTEAEAASIDILHRGAIDFSMGSLFLVVHVGGDTVETSVMKVTGTDSPQVSQKTASRNIGVGSMCLDQAFVGLINQRLGEHPSAQDTLSTDLAMKMAKSRHFETIKYKFGEKLYERKVFKIPIEGVSFDFDHPGLCVESGRMMFSKQEIQSLFDAQIDGITGQIRNQLDWITQNNVTETLEFVVLTGEFGNIAYVREMAQQWLLRYDHPNARKVTVLPGLDPELTAVRGLLLSGQPRAKPRNPIPVVREATVVHRRVVPEQQNHDVNVDEGARQGSYDAGEKRAVDGELPDVVLDFQLETQIGGSRRYVTHVVHDPGLPPSAAPRLESWRSDKKRIGRGGQGDVLLQRCISSGPRHENVRALKVIRVDHDEKRRYVRELETMVRFSHERYSKVFVKMLGWYITQDDELCIALEYLPHGDLHSLLKDRPPLQESDAREVIGQVLQGLAIMHKAKFAHRDIKPQNVLVQHHPLVDGGSDYWWVKLTDFGISKSIEVTNSVVGIGTFAYMAPELLQRFTKASELELRLADIWSVGVMAFYLLTKSTDYVVWRASLNGGDSKTQPSMGARASLGLLGNDISTDGVRFLSHAIKDSPAERLRWEEAPGHDWVARNKQVLPPLPIEAALDDRLSDASGETSSLTDSSNEIVEKGLTTNLDDTYTREEPATILSRNILRTTENQSSNSRPDVVVSRGEHTWQKMKAAIDAGRASVRRR